MSLIDVTPTGLSHIALLPTAAPLTSLFRLVASLLGTRAAHFDAVNLIVITIDAPLELATPLCVARLVASHHPLASKPHWLVGALHGTRLYLRGVVVAPPPSGVLHHMDFCTLDDAHARGIFNAAPQAQHAPQALARRDSVVAVAANVPAVPAWREALDSTHCYYYDGRRPTGMDTLNVWRLRRQARTRFRAILTRTWFDAVEETASDRNATNALVHVLMSVLAYEASVLAWFVDAELAYERATLLRVVGANGDFTRARDAIDAMMESARHALSIDTALCVRHAKRAAMPEGIAAFGDYVLSDLIVPHYFGRE